MRVQIGRSLIFFLWTEQQYRNEVVRLVQGLDRHLVRLIRARRVLGYSLLLVRRTPERRSPA
jgi:hypothetical protein